jgi:hypothetical protein
VGYGFSLQHIALRCHVLEAFTVSAQSSCPSPDAVITYIRKQMCIFPIDRIAWARAQEEQELAPDPQTIGEIIDSWIVCEYVFHKRNSLIVLLTVARTSRTLSHIMISFAP